jgi:hypothetical protein
MPITLFEVFNTNQDAASSFFHFCALGATELLRRSDAPQADPEY